MNTALVLCGILTTLAQAGLAMADSSGRGAETRPAGQGEQPLAKDAPSDRPVCRLGAINVPYEYFPWYLANGYDFIGKVHGGPAGSSEEVRRILAERGIEHFTYGLGSVEIDDMGPDKVPVERRGLKRGPGTNKYNNLDSVCGGWDAQYRFCGEKTAAKIKEARESGIIFEDYLNRALCYCPACEAEYRHDTGRPGFPERIYETPHYEDTVAFDPVLFTWDQHRLARHLQTMAEPIHRAGKKVMVAGVCRWIVGPEAASAVDGVMFYTYYAGRRLPPNYMRNWKYWHDHLITSNLWTIFGYFREYHTCHTRVLLANLPDGVNLAFWACGRQMGDASTREDAVYAHDVVTSRLLPIRVAVYDSGPTQEYWGRTHREWRKTHVEKAAIGLERLGLDAQSVASLDNLDGFEAVYMEDVECLSRSDVDRIRSLNVPVIATGITGLRDEQGRLWKDMAPSLLPGGKDEKVLNLPSPVSLSSDRLNVEVESMRLEHPWFEFMFETVSRNRGHGSTSRPYTDPAYYHGIKRYELSLIPSRVYGEFLENALVARHEGDVLAYSNETRRPMVVYDRQRQQVYSTIKFSDYVDVNDLTECGYGYQMRQFCFLQLFDALTLPRRGVQIDPYLPTAVRATSRGLFLTIGNVHDEPRTVTLTLPREPGEVRVNHVHHADRPGRRIVLPPIGPKDAIHVHVDY